MKTLKIRNNKRIYSKSKNVVGKDIVFPITIQIRFNIKK